MKKITLILAMTLLTGSFLCSSCARQMERRAKKAKTTENKTEGYLYYQNDQGVKGDSAVKKNVNN